MSADRPLSRSGRLYVAAVALCGAVALADSVRRMVAAPPDFTWLIVAVLTWVSGAFAIRIPTIAATLSISEVFVFTLVILFGCPTATITVAADGLIASFTLRTFRARRLLFNVAEPAFSTWVAARCYDAVGGPAPLSSAPSTLSDLVLPVLLFAGVYLALNLTLISIAVRLESGPRKSAVEWRTHIAWLAVNFMGGASIALLLTSNMRQISLQLVLLALPLLVVLHMVLSTWTQRLEEAEEHVEQLNRLYFSTVRALAIAIESKDQVTHSHVCRVQALSLAVARELAVTDPLQLRAIEAAALLHDMGKVAIPDHILNKPGRLSPAEYDLMKLHAPIGAEILSAVDFPYPVVPIVRHHHENWDGTGYPDGIAGDAIPLGARILSVVDCFDALTSDRPYRRALTKADALRMIEARSGTKYDPAVTRALIAIDPAPAADDAGGAPAVSLLIARANAALRPEPADTTGADQGVADWATLDRVWRLLCAGPHAAGAGELAPSAIATFLRTVTSSTTVWIGRVDVARQQVTVAHVYGHGEQLLRGRTVLLGEGVSGWVAANRAPIANSDPALDFAREIESLSPRPSSALSVPIDGRGVLTLYTDDAQGFNARDLEIARQAAVRLNVWLSAVAGEGLDADDPLLGHVVAAASDGVGILSVTRRADARATDVSDLAAMVLPAIRIGDGLVATGDDEIVAVLPGCEPGAEEILKSRLLAAVSTTRQVLQAVDVGFAVTPRDGLTASDALRTARAQRRCLLHDSDCDENGCDDAACVRVGTQAELPR